MELIKTVSAQNQRVSIDGNYPFATHYGFSSLGEFVQRILPLAFSVAALMVVFYFIIGAFELITSQGDKAHIVSARSKIYHSIIGFILLIVIFLVMQYLLPALGVDLSII